MKVFFALLVFMTFAASAASAIPIFKPEGSVKLKLPSGSLLHVSRDTADPHLYYYAGASRLGTCQNEQVPFKFHYTQDPIPSLEIEYTVCFWISSVGIVYEPLLEFDPLARVVATYKQNHLFRNYGTVPWDSAVGSETCERHDQYLTCSNRFEGDVATKIFNDSKTSGKFKLSQIAKSLMFTIEVDCNPTSESSVSGCRAVDENKTVYVLQTTAHMFSWALPQEN